MKSRIRIRLLPFAIVSLCALGGCLTFSYGPIGYLEPGGNGPGENSKTFRKCGLLNQDLITGGLNVGNEKYATKAWKNMSITIPFGFSPCLVFKGKPVE